MHTQDWALVTFTLLMQSAIGTLLVVVAVVSLSPGAVSTAAAADLPIAAAACAGVLALIISLLHLGHPGQAWLALANIRKSWLSREIAGSMLFVASTVVLFLMRRTYAGAAISLFVVVTGVIALYAMSRLYMVRAQPVWNRLATPLAFGGTALLLGTAVVAVTARLEPSAVRNLALGASALMVVDTAVTGGYVAGFAREPAAAISAAATRWTVVWLSGIRIATALLAVVLLFRIAATPATLSPLAGTATVFLVLASELAARTLFYTGRASIAAC